MTIAIYNNNIIIIIPISLLFFASACLLAVEMRLSISELVMFDTVCMHDIKTYTRYRKCHTIIIMHACYADFILIHL